MTASIIISQVIRVVIVCALTLSIPFIAKFYPSLAGMLGVLPLTSGVIFLMTCQGMPTEDAETIALYAAGGMIPGAIFYIVIFFGIRGGLCSYSAFALGTTCCALVSGCLMPVIHLLRG